MNKIKKVGLTAGAVTLLVLGGGAAFLAHVIPHGKNVDVVDSSFEEVRLQAESSCGAIETCTTGSQLVSAVSSCNDALRDLATTATSLNGIEGDRDSIRDIWQKPSFTLGKVKEVETEIEGKLASVPDTSKAVFVKVVQRGEESIRRTGSWQKVDGQLKDVQNEIVAIVDSLSVISDDQGELARQKSILFEEANASLSEMGGFCCSGSRSGAAVRIGLGSRPASRSQQCETCRRGRLKHSWQTLHSIESALQTASSFAPTRDLVQSELASIKGDAGEMNAILAVVSRIVSAQKKANEQLVSGIKEMDRANQRLERLERYARSKEIKEVSNLWEHAGRLVNFARSDLRVPSDLAGNHHPIWEGCNKKGYRKHRARVQHGV